MLKPILLTIFLSALGTVFPSSANAGQDPAAVKQAVEQFLRVQTKGIPGSVTYSVGAVAPGNQLSPCPALGVSLPPGARLWGRSNVLVSCQVEGGWSLYIPIQVRVVSDYLVAARNLARGQVITPDDISRRSGDITDMPAGTLSNTDEALGRVVSQSLVAGRPLRADLLSQAWAVQQGQSVRVSTKGPGFQVTNEGRALNNAVDGQVVQVRLSNNGQVVSGIARTGGFVEIRF